MFVLTISRRDPNMSFVGSKTRSPGQMLGNSCLHSRGQIGDPIFFIKLGQNACLDSVYAKFEYESCRVNKLSQILDNYCVY